MTSLLFSAFLKEVLLARGSLHGKWENKKFRFMYLLRCILNPVASVQYYYKLLSLQSIDKLLEIHPTLPAKIHRPYLHKGGCAHTRGEYIIGHYRFVQSLPHKYQTFLFPCETVSLIQFAEKMVNILIFSVLHATLTVKGINAITLFQQDTCCPTIVFHYYDKERPLCVYWRTTGSTKKYWPGSYSGCH